MAVTVAVPAPLAVTTPLLFTLTTEVSEEDHVISSPKFAGVTVTVRVSVSPSAIVKDSSEIVTFSIRFFSSETITDAVLSKFPSSVLAVTTAFPSETPVNLPSSSIFTIDSSEDVIV